jgi:hypothetical protein
VSSSAGRDLSDEPVTRLDNLSTGAKVLGIALYISSRYIPTLTKVSFNSGSTKVCKEQSRITWSSKTKASMTSTDQSSSTTTTKNSSPSDDQQQDPRNVILKDGDVLRLQVSPTYANIQVIPNGDEGHDANFPRNLHNAAELFLKCGLVAHAVKLKECTDAVLELYQQDPASRQHSLKLGRACVCWECGYCGIPKEYEETQVQPGPCANCNGSTQINWVQINNHASSVTNNTEQDDKNNSNVLPWVEKANKSEQEQQEELAAKRAAVEARVAAALKAREEKDAKNAATAS